MKQLNNNLGLKVDSVKVVAQNAVIFSAKGLQLLEGLGANVTKVGDKNYIINTNDNTATEVTSAGIAEQAVADFKEGLETPATKFATQFGLITKLSLVKDADSKTAGLPAHLSSHGLKVKSIEIVEQDAIIFKSQGVKNFASTTSGGKQYILDVDANEAKELDAASITTNAKAAFEADDFVPNQYTDFVEKYNLIKSVVLVKA